MILLLLQERLIFRKELTLNSFYQEGERWLEENPDCEFDIVAEKIRHMKFIKASYEENFLFMFKRAPGYMECLVDNANMVAEKYEDKARLQFKFGVYEIERENDESISAMSEKAFMALTSARERFGTDVAYYNSKLHEKNIMEERLCMDLSQGIEDEQFQIYFQPKYCLRTNTITGVEALVRWFHPTQGLISPGIFIPLF